MFRELGVVAVFSVRSRNTFFFSVMQVCVLDEEFSFPGPASISFAAPEDLPEPPKSLGMYFTGKVCKKHLNLRISTVERP